MVWRLRQRRAMEVGQLTWVNRHVTAGCSSTSSLSASYHPLQWYSTSLQLTPRCREAVWRIAVWRSASLQWSRACCYWHCCCRFLHCPSVVRPSSRRSLELRPAKRPGRAGGSRWCVAGGERAVCGRPGRYSRPAADRPCAVQPAPSPAVRRPACETPSTHVRQFIAGLDTALHCWNG